MLCTSRLAMLRLGRYISSGYVMEIMNQETIYKPLIPQSLDLPGRMLCGESCFRFISGGIGKLTREINDGG